MTQIVVDLDALSHLGDVWSRATDELAAIAADLRSRVAAVDFSMLDSYGIPSAGLLPGLEQVTEQMVSDSMGLEDGTSSLRRTLLLGIEVQGANRSMYSAALPDLWWFKSNELTPGRGVPAAHLDQTAYALPGVQAAPAVVPDAASVPAGANALNPPGGGSGTVTLPADTSQTRADIVATSEKWLGIPYLWGGGHGSVVGVRETNVDCSGLVHQVFGENGISIAGTAQDMYNAGIPVPSLAQAQPGDLLFWGRPGDIHHVAIYVGNGEMIEAPHTGAFVQEVRVYSQGFAGIRQVPDI
jgi:cell wall-associated NlpC family hydrolase